MRLSLAVATLAAAGMTASVASAAAQPLHHHRHHAYHHHRYGHAPVAGGYGQGQGYGDARYGYPGGAYGAGQIIEDATIRQQHAPGVTNELAPDAKESATGGPSGGVPGFSR